MDRDRHERDRGREDFDRDDRRASFGDDRLGYGQSRGAARGGDYGSQGRHMSGDERRGFRERSSGDDEYGPHGGGDYSHGDYRGGVGSGDRSWRGMEPRRHDHGYDRYASEGFRGDYGGHYRGEDDWRRSGVHSGESYRGDRVGSGDRRLDHSSGISSSRSYGGGERGQSQGGRSFWDKAGDEVASWFGDRDAEARRQNEHRGRGPKGYSRSDDRIREDVNDRLTEDGWLDASNIDVAVKDREVTLSGTVSDRGSKRRAEDIAESVSGVEHVQNNLRVHRSENRSGMDVEREGAALVAKPTGGGAR
ncbi:MAG TPA: BON domain-containing protein [Mesorhizobium sp.]|jgi:osmotically-inducible protein OsmY|nr:BON domain-containing protein [Mesorhizobium sp.]